MPRMTTTKEVVHIVASNREDFHDKVTKIFNDLHSRGLNARIAFTNNSFKTLTGTNFSLAIIEGYVIEGGTDEIKFSN